MLDENGRISMGGKVAVARELALTRGTIHVPRKRGRQSIEDGAVAVGVAARMKGHSRGNSKRSNKEIQDLIFLVLLPRTPTEHAIAQAPHIPRATVQSYMVAGLRRGVFSSVKPRQQRGTLQSGLLSASPIFSQKYSRSTT